jgi:hypothetical protein
MNAYATALYNDEKTNGVLIIILNLTVQGSNKVSYFLNFVKFFFTGGMSILRNFRKVGSVSRETGEQ